MSKQALSILIPAYNEADNLPFVVRESQEALSKLTDNFDIVVIDDCSTDNTQAVLEQLKTEIPQLVVIRNAENSGCHPSSLIGFRAAQGAFRYFIPGDRQIPAAELPKFLNKALSDNCDVVYSHRVKRADAPHRLFISKTYNFLVRFLFGIKVHDVDSSSMLSARAVEEILPVIRSDSAFISVEILIEAQRRNLKIGEVEIEHLPRVAGVAKGINLKDGLMVPVNLIRMVGWFWQKKLFG